jgi:predicted lipoprotein with Yx(FWY)xxD motif
MKRMMMALATAGVLALAACSGAGYGNGDTSPVPQSGDDAATISVKELGDSGRVLVDSTGKALYAADEEADPSVVCTGGCINFWIPLTVDESPPTGTSLPTDLGVVERSDGTKQVTFDGKRLYTFANDEPGEVSGDGLSDAFDDQQFTWHVVSLSDIPDSNREGGSSGY